MNVSNARITVSIGVICSFGMLSRSSFGPNAVGTNAGQMQLTRMSSLAKMGPTDRTNPTIYSSGN